MGAAEKMHFLHWSNPSPYLTLLNTSFLAKPQNLGKGPPFISAYVPSAPILLAQSAIFLFKPVVSWPRAVSFSSIFYQTLGTVTKKVLNNL